MADNITLQLSRQEIDLLAELDTMLRQIKQEEAAIHGAIQEMNNIKKESVKIDKAHAMMIHEHLVKVHGLLTVMDKFNSTEEQETPAVKTKLSILDEFISKLASQLR